MKAQLTEVLWLDEHQEISLAQLAELSGLTEDELRELTGYGAFVPVDTAAGTPSYRAECVVTARTAFRLQKDMELNMEGLALVLSLLERMHGLETRLKDLKARSPAGSGL